MSNTPPRAPNIPASMRRPWDPTAFMSSLAIAVTAWLILGAIGSQDWEPETLELLNILGCMLLFAELGALAVAVDCAGHGWPNRIAAMFAAGVLGFGIAVCAVMSMSGWRNFLHGLVWSLSGIYVGAAAEALTGAFQGLHGLLAASADADRARWVKDAETAGKAA